MVVLEYIYTLAAAAWETLCEMSPYLLLGFFIAGLLSVYIRPEIVERHLGGRGLLQVVKAALFGVPLPLCSCGVIPVSASIRKHGASAGATTSFLISTPQTGVDSIFVTLSLLGPIFAVVRPIVSFVSGLIGGTLVSFFGEKEGSAEDKKPVCHAECCSGDCEKRGFRGVVRYGFVTLVDDLYKALIIGILIAGAISAVVPDDFFTPVLGGGIISMLILMAAGIPVYVCATASVPIAAALIAKGVSPGAALAFLMTGPATNAATIGTVWKIMGKKTAVIYLATVAGSAIAAGLLLDYFFISGSLPATSSMPWMIPGYVKTASGVVLLLLLLAAAFRRPKLETGPIEEMGEESMKIKIDGMTCHHCASAVRRALLETEGVKTAEVDHKKGIAYVTGPALDSESMKKAVEEVGYEYAGILEDI